MSIFTEPSEWTVFTFLPRLDLWRICDLVRSVELGFRPTEARIQALGAGPITAPYDDAVWETILATPEVHGFELETDGSTPSLGCSVLGSCAEVMVSDVPRTESPRRHGTFPAVFLGCQVPDDPLTRCLAEHQGVRRRQS